MPPLVSSGPAIDQTLPAHRHEESPMPVTPEGPPRSSLGSAFVQLHGSGWDAFYSIRVLVPWSAIERVVAVELEVGVPVGFEAEVTFSDARCPSMTYRAVDGAPTPPSGVTLLLPAAVRLLQLSAGFPFAVRFTDSAGKLGEMTDQADHVLEFTTLARLVRRAA